MGLSMDETIVYFLLKKKKPSEETDFFWHVFLDFSFIPSKAIFISFGSTCEATENEVKLSRLVGGGLRPIEKREFMERMKESLTKK